MAARGLGLRVGQEETDFQWRASVTCRVPAALSLGRSGPRAGQEVGFLVSGVLEQVSSQLAAKYEDWSQWSCALG